MKKTILIGLIALVLIALVYANPETDTVTNTKPADASYSNNAISQNFTATPVIMNLVNQTLVNLSVYIDGIINSTNSTALTNNTLYNFTVTVNLADGARTWKVEFCTNDTTTPCGNSTAFTLNIDTVTPTGSSLTDSETSGDFRITFTPSESINATLNYGLCSATCALASTVKVTTRTTSPNMAVSGSGLTAGSNYCYNVTFSDQVNENTTGFAGGNNSGCASMGTFLSNPATTASGSSTASSTSVADETTTEDTTTEDEGTGAEEMQKKTAGEVWRDIIGWFKGIRCWFSTKC